MARDISISIPSSNDVKKVLTPEEEILQVESMLKQAIDAAPEREDLRERLRDVETIKSQLNGSTIIPGIDAKATEVAEVSKSQGVVSEQRSQEMRKVQSFQSSYPYQMSRGDVFPSYSGIEPSQVSYLQHNINDLFSNFAKA